ncbi:hypothetical protein HRbin20_01235 [bacterium HR20]|nr:hypothetical protein HRbin20_01235 [bacterium HR20]
MLRFRTTFCLLVFPVTALAQPQWRLFEDTLQLGRHSFQALAIRPSQVLVIGGFTRAVGGLIGQPARECEIIDIEQRKVLPVSPMNVGRSDFAALRTPDSNVIVISGVTGYVSTEGGSGTLTQTVELYERTSNRWRVLGNLIVARRQHTAIWLDDHRILIVGGRLEDLSSTASAEIFDIQTGVSQLAPPYPYSMTDLVSARTRTGRILVWGGRQGGPNSFRTNEIYEYTPTGWRLYQTMPEVIRSPSVIALADGRVLFCGGSQQETPQFIFPRGIYIERNGLFMRLQDSLLIGRAWHDLVHWTADSVLVIGGFMGGAKWTSTRSCEIFNIATGRSVQSAPLAVARGYGKVLDLNAPSMPRTVLAISGLDSTNRNTPTIEILERKCPERAVTITGARSLCPGDTLLLSADSGFVRYRWSTGDTTRSLRISSPGTYTVTATDADSCTATGDVTVTAAPGAILLHTRSTPAHVPIGTIWCDTVELLNPSDVPLLLDSLWLARNVEWSLPLHQLPLELAPGERRTLLVCWSSWARGEHRDTLVLTTPCGIKLLPLALLATDIQWKAHSSCGVTIESILADDAMTTLITAAHLVRIRDLVGRVVFEHIGDGQATPIAIPGGLRPGIYLLERDEVRSLLLVR